MRFSQSSAQAVPRLKGSCIKPFAMDQPHLFDSHAASSVAQVNQGRAQDLGRGPCVNNMLQSPQRLSRPQEGATHTLRNTDLKPSNEETNAIISDNGHVSVDAREAAEALTQHYANESRLAFSSYDKHFARVIRNQVKSCRDQPADNPLFNVDFILPELHWCAKIKDEVEKLAYQLNEEAERTAERPIRRLSKVMYGSTCADMQVDVMGECLSSIKHVVSREMANNQSVRRHLDAFTRGRIIGKLEEGRSVTSVAAEFGIAHSIVSRLWRQFQTTGTAIRGFRSGRPRGTTPADDRYIVLQARRNRRQTVGEIARHTTQATGRPISRFTVAKRLHGGGLFARCPEWCVPLTPAHRRRRSLWCREHRNWRDNEWGRILFTDESRFSLSSDSHRILIWRERGSRNHPSNIIERDRYGGRGVLVWGGIMLGSRTDLHIFDAGSVNGTRYCNEILLPYVRLFRGAMGLQFLFMDDNAPCHRTVAAEQLLESEDIERMDWPA
ncbi:transposable element Tcb2 transposase [Trichonephila clavipes]|nr:transposable element Tcb2 transposase [Trichonephila clavipes]